MERPTPSENKRFEMLCRDFISLEYPMYSHFTLYGANGEKQFGCDILNQDRTLIVQCKCYDNAKANAYDRFVDEISKDYNSACSHFPQMERFAVCTTLDKKRIAQDNVRSIAQNIPIDVWFWDDIYNIPGGELLTNKSYSSDFEAPLFLHKDIPSVCLKNLYEPNPYHVFQVKQDSLFHGDKLLQGGISTMREEEDTDDKLEAIKSCGDIWTQLAWFIQTTEDTLLIIEGDAGCGKTSLVQALCWHEQENDSIAEKVFGSRPLLTVRLRDLDKDNVAKENGLLQAILDYLQIPGTLQYERKKLLMRRFPSAVLLLDGFDELCIIDNYSNCDLLLYKLMQEGLTGWKIIVTSRPNFIKKRPHFSYIVLALEHFTRENRINWIRKYTDSCLGSQRILPEVEEYILEGREKGVFDTPLSLYLLAAGNITAGDTENLWQIYRQLFHNEIAIRNYEHVYHPGIDYLDYAYCLPGEVSHKIYCKGYSRPWISETELASISADFYGFTPQKPDVCLNGYVPPNNKIDGMEISKRCVALCCYWKVHEKRGVVEFYHNNIRDFFLCEKIFGSITFFVG